MQVPAPLALSGAQLFSALEQAVLVVEESSRRVIWRNAAAERLLGAAEGLQTLTDLLPGANLSAVDRSGLSAREPGAPLAFSAIQEGFARRASGPDLPVAFVQLRIDLPGSGDAYLLVVLWEQSGAPEAAETRRLRDEQILQAQKLEVIGALAGGIAHDFNNLLTVILGFSELLQAQVELADPKRLFVDEIVQAGQRAAALTRQLLAFSRRQLLELVDLDLNAAVTDALNMVRQLVGVNIELVTHLDSSLGHIRADAGQLQQVLLNLVINARDAMPSGGRLIIETANVELDEADAARRYPMAPGPYVQLTVRDTGQGMDAETQAHLFEPFFTTKGPGKGTGLGLATVYGIVKQSQGDIWVQSAIGEGTSFHLYFPPLEPDLTPTERTAAPRALTAELPASRTVLLVEDGDAVRQLAKTILQHQGYTILEASNGESALQLVAEHAGPIDLVLTDVILPGVDGREVADWVRARHAGARVLYMSGFAQRILDRAQLGTGVGFLQKPFTPAALSETVAQLLAEG